MRTLAEARMGDEGITQQGWIVVVAIPGAYIVKASKISTASR
jgi:hypothetical protein